MRHDVHSLPSGSLYPANLGKPLLPLKGCGAAAGVLILDLCTIHNQDNVSKTKMPADQ